VTRFSKKNLDVKCKLYNLEKKCRNSDFCLFVISNIKQNKQYLALLLLRFGFELPPYVAIGNHLFFEERWKLDVGDLSICLCQSEEGVSWGGGVNITAKYTTGGEGDHKLSMKRRMYHIPYIRSGKVKLI